MMIKYITKVGVIGGIILFLWSFLSWTILPWHHTTTHQFINESQVATVLKDNAHKKGIYLIPFADTQKVDGITSAFVSIIPSTSINDMNMVRNSIIDIICNTLLMMIAGIYLYRTTDIGMTMTGHILYMGMLGLLIGLGGYLPFWNWFGFDIKFVMGMIADSTIAWALSGAAIAKFAPTYTAPEPENDQRHPS
jgi:hypothetical protein